MATTDDQPVCGPCSLDVHDDCHRHDGEPCGCGATSACGRAVRVFEAKGAVTTDDRPITIRRGDLDLLLAPPLTGNSGPRSRATALLFADEEQRRSEEQEEDEREEWLVPDLGGDSQDPSMAPEDRVLAEPGKGNVLASRVRGQGPVEHEGEALHLPCIDIDLPCRLVPSETPGHFHLYIEHKVTWARYQDLLKALVDAGIVQEGYFRAAVKRGRTFVALRPWKKSPSAGPL